MSEEFARRLLQPDRAQLPRMVSKHVTVNEPDGHIVKLVAAYNALRLPLGMLSDG